METTRGMQLAFAQMQSDCEHKAGRDIVDRRPWLQAAPDRFTMVRTVLADNQPSRLQVVSYRIANGVLVRRESAPTRDLVQLDALWQAALSDADPSPAVALTAGVTGMQVSMWQNGVWHLAGTDPAANVTATATAAPPAAVPPMLAAGNGQAQPNADPTGLRVSLQGRGQEAPLVKSFLLGEP